MNSKKKGDLLEKVVGRLCSKLSNAKVSNNIKLKGKSGERQIDTLIEGNIGAFPIKIVVDAKNHKDPIDVNIVDSIIGMVDDVGANLGAIVCPSGFTKGSKDRAKVSGLLLYEVCDEELGNTSLFIPVRYAAPFIDKFNLTFERSSASGPFSMTTNTSNLIFHIEGKEYKRDDVPIYLWNSGKVPKKPGFYEPTIGAIKITDITDENYIQYCDLKVGIWIDANYYLKMYPVSSLKRVDDEEGKEHFELTTHSYSSKEDMLKNGWKHFSTLEELNQAADPLDNSKDVFGIFMIENCKFDVN